MSLNRHFDFLLVITMSNKEYSDLCLRLDILAMDVLNLMQKIVQEREHLNALLKNGFADIAKSRYVMGRNSVSLLQINESDITASQKVQFADSVNKNNVKFKCFNMLEKHIDSYPNIARQRKLKKDVDELVSSTKSCSISDDKQHSGENSKEQNLDPIRWFGVLVPQSLRSAQSSFKESVFSATHIVSLQNELNAISKEYKCLNIKKNSLKNERKDGESHEVL